MCVTATRCLQLAINCITLLFIVCQCTTILDRCFISQIILPTELCLSLHTRRQPCHKCRGSRSCCPIYIEIPEPHVCAGCRGGYVKKTNGSLPDPPFDICVSHETFITLTHPVKKTPFEKKTKSHYHASPIMHCPQTPSIQTFIPSNTGRDCSKTFTSAMGIHFGITSQD